MKLSIAIGTLAGSVIGGWLGSLLDHGSMLGIWGIILSGFGAIVGIFAGYKLYRAYHE